MVSRRLSFSTLHEQQLSRFSCVHHQGVLQEFPLVLEQNIMKKTPAMRHFFPALICAEYDSPIDALISLHVPQNEAMDLVTASWVVRRMECILASVDGGRDVAAIRLPSGRWAACNAFIEKACSSEREAERLMQKLLKHGRKGAIGSMEAV